MGSASGGWWSVPARPSKRRNGGCGARVARCSKPMLMLQGERCLVRPWRKTDVAALVKHADNPNIAKNLRDRFPSPYSQKDAKAFLKFASAEQDPSNLAIEVDGEAVGAVGYVPGRDVERFSAEIGYWLGESMWG